MSASLDQQIKKAQTELAAIKQEMTNYVMVPRQEYELLRPTGLADELNRIGYEMAERRLRAAEGFARNALAMTPYTGESAAEFAKRLRFWAERNHPELIVRLEDHQRQEILPLAETCGCDPTSPGYEDDHCESGDDLEDLCARQHLGFVCATCVNENGDGPSWRPDRYEWPCPPVAALDNPPKAELKT